jgi:hypothetical protein
MVQTVLLLVLGAVVILPPSCHSTNSSASRHQIKIATRERFIDWEPINVHTWVEIDGAGR